MNIQKNISEELLNSIQTLILYRSLYLLKQKFAVNKHKLIEFYKEYNINTNNNKIFFYQINKGDFAKITELVFKQINLLIIKIHNPKDIFLSKVIKTDKIEEMICVLQVIQVLINTNSVNIKNYNQIYFNKKIEQQSSKIDLCEDNFSKNNTSLKEELKNNFDDNNINKNNNNENNISKFKNKDEEITIKIVEYNKKGKIIKTYQDSIIQDSKYNNNSSINEPLYVWTIPLIIADFLQEYKKYAIIEFEDELFTELNILFDKDLLTKIDNYEKFKILSRNEKNVDLHNALKEYSKINANIKIYQEVINEKKLNNENVDYLNNMIEKLFSKQILLGNKIKYYEEIQKHSSLNNNTSIKNNKKKYNLSILLKSGQPTNIQNAIILNDNRDNIINNAIEEIFNFYSNQHYLVGSSLLFSTIEQKKQHIDLFEFSKFCREFNIPLSNQKVIEIFKKIGSNIHLISLDEFKKSIGLLAKAIHESQLLSLKNLIKSKKLKTNNKIKDQNINYELYELQKNYEIQRLMSMNEKYTDFCEFLGLLSDNKEYRNKMKGFNKNRSPLNKNIKINFLVNSQYTGKKDVFKLNELQKMKEKKFLFNNSKSPRFAFLREINNNSYLNHHEFIKTRNKNKNKTKFKQIINWSKLESFDINQLGLDKFEKEIFEDSENENSNNNCIINSKSVFKSSDFGYSHMRAGDKIVLPHISNNNSKRDMKNYMSLKKAENKMKKNISEVNLIKKGDNYCNSIFSYNNKKKINENKNTSCIIDKNLYFK